MKTATKQQQTEKNGVTRQKIDRFAALVASGIMSPDEAMAKLEASMQQATEGRRAWARGRLRWVIEHGTLIGSLPRTLIVADTCTSEPPDWCGTYIGKQLFAVACMQGAMAYPFQMAGSGYAKAVVEGVVETSWRTWTREQVREIDRIKKQVKRFVQRATDRGFMSETAESRARIQRPHEHAPAKTYALTRQGIETAEQVLKENPQMLDYAKRMGWYNDDGIPY